MISIDVIIFISKIFFVILQAVLILILIYGRKDNA